MLQVRGKRKTRLSQRSHSGDSGEKPKKLLDDLFEAWRFWLAKASVVIYGGRSFVETCAWCWVRYVGKLVVKNMLRFFGSRQYSPPW